MIAIYTIDYLPEREHLMPWRTVAEVAKYIHSQGRHVTILNGFSGTTAIRDFETGSVPVIGIRHSFIELAETVKRKEFTSVAVPVTWRDGLKDWSAFKTIKCKKLAYFAGGVYRMKDAIQLWRSSSLSIAKPYLIESIVPKGMLTKKLADAGFTEVIALTPFTADRFAKHPALNVSCIMPGKDIFESLPEDDSILKKYQLEGKKFLCYTGAPSPVRGSEWLLKAADQINEPDFRLVMLMRTDVGSDFLRFEQKLKQLQHPENIIIIGDKLTREQLKAFFSHAYAMVLPFIVIPSEIPLTYLEVLSCGTPIITFDNGGTTRLLNDGLVISSKKKNSLADTLSLAWNNVHLYEIGQQGKSFIQQYPSWEQVAENWLNVLI